MELGDIRLAADQGLFRKRQGTAPDVALATIADGKLAPEHGCSRFLGDRCFQINDRRVDERWIVGLQLGLCQLIQDDRRGRQEVGGFPVVDNGLPDLPAFEQDLTLQFVEVGVVGVFGDQSVH